MSESSTSSGAESIDVEPGSTLTGVGRGVAREADDVSVARRSRRKRQLPPFLVGSVTESQYSRWLLRKAHTHVVRDRTRGLAARGAQYRDAIHAAVLASKGLDDYTGERLDWRLISTYANEQSQAGGRRYKAGFELLPTVDHVEASAATAAFKICGWRTNNAKSDLSVDGFLALCLRVLVHAGYSVEPPSGTLS